MSSACPEIANIILCRPWLCWFALVMPCSALADFGSDTIFQGQQLRDGGKYLSSPNKLFQLRFFNPVNSTSHYLGIFQGDGDRPVWIANRNNPIYDSSGTLEINSTDGMLYILYSRGHITLPRVPTTSDSGYGNINTSASLRDDGNLVLREVYRNGSIGGTLLWQSFDHPTDTLLPGMKLGIDLKTEHKWLLTSWVSTEVPLSGSFTLGVDNSSTNQLIIWWNDIAYWTSGPWHNGSFKNLNMSLVSQYEGSFFNYISNENEKYFTYSAKDGTHTEAVRLTKDGYVVGKPKFDYEIVRCDVYSKHPQSGCQNYSSQVCMKDVGNIYNFKETRYDDTLSSPFKEDYNNLSIIDCKVKCMQNCSCYGYASLYENGTGCAFWDEAAVGRISENGGASRSIFLLVVAKKRGNWWTQLIVALVGTILILLLSILFIQRKYCRKGREPQNVMRHELAGTSTPPGEYMMSHEWSNEQNPKISQVNQFYFQTIQMATNNFSKENKIGEGGFGPVYKGKLLDGQKIAVKKLSRSSTQGIVEFMNEIQLIVKLQHNNLVRLLGYCIHQGDMILVYEYMPNKSLDCFLFDPTKRELLRWPERMNIIEGIAEGLLYLHKHSRLRIIHRDLKASNILLDMNMNPKISDFGLARIFGMQDCETSTRRIVGTHGYMAPEYAIHGVVSTKIDVFSFGVLILEIVSGKKNNRSYDFDRLLNLIGMAWELWNKDRALELVDPTMDGSINPIEVQRCIYAALLCVQDNPADRPFMKDVISVLTNESLQLPNPKKPAFFVETSKLDNEIEEGIEEYSVNTLSVSVMDAR